MLRIYVMRHAKSSWANPGASDFERELNDRGNSDLKAIATALLERNYLPSHVICSPAIRTTRTLEGIKQVFPPDTSIEFREELYSGGMADYLGAIRSLGNAGSLMLIGHNPTCGSLAAMLSGSGDAEALQQLAYKFPTGAIAVIDLDIDEWGQIDRGIGNLVECVLPRQLK